MPEYAPSYVNDVYSSSVSSPILDKIVFTIDHIHMGGPGIYSTFDIVKHLVKNKIPVTVFIECSDPANLCKIDRIHAKAIYQLNPDFVSLGAHALPKGNTQKEQSKRLALVNDIINDITGSPSTILSYHGSGAGPEPGIIYDDIKFARGIKPWVAAQRLNPLDTPVMPLSSVNTAFRYTKLRNKAGLSATLFVHSVELRSFNPQKKVFDTFVSQVKQRKLQALKYSSAMKQDYSNKNILKCPLAHFTNNHVSQNLYVGHVDGSGSVFQVKQLQKFLNQLGYDIGTPDGVYGPETGMAIVMYQVDNGLTVDGQVGNKTRESINSFCGQAVDLDTPP